MPVSPHAGARYDRPFDLAWAIMTVEKACPVVVRRRGSRLDVLAFDHPSAGKQFVKGTIEPGESPIAAAARELREESGLAIASAMTFLGAHRIGPERQLWHFFRYAASGLPDAWQHATADDHGHIFSFFWHPLDMPLNQDWHPVFREAFGVFAPRLGPR